MTTTTALGIPKPELTDVPDGASQMGAMADVINTLLTARLQSAAHHRGGHANMTGMSSGSNPVAGGWTLLSTIGDITYSAGIYTVTRAGIYVWAATCGIAMTGASFIAINALVNGADLTNYDGGITATGPRTIFSITAGSPIGLSAGDTVQLEVLITSTPSGVTVSPQTFSLYKVA